MSVVALVRAFYDLVPAVRRRIVVEQRPSSDVAFTPAVKAMQSRRGSREAYAKMEARGGFRTNITPDLIGFLTEIDTAYLATANAGGQPYAQHRGGPKGFIRALNETTLGFADYSGNRQYVTLGNLTENEQAFLFLMDYADRRRIKIWGRARAVEDDPELVSRLMPQGYAARADQAVLFDVEAWDVNCPPHIPQKLDAAEVAEVLATLRNRIEGLEAENRKLCAALGMPSKEPS
jgi:predicted pyridoxine 5'-phosphate oxidase superfamily flavin-nucleotide-binding protein